MHSEASQTISNCFLETLGTMATDILLMMVIEFSEIKHDYKIRRKITVKQHEKRNNDRWRNFRWAF